MNTSHPPLTEETVITFITHKNVLEQEMSQLNLAFHRLSLTAQLMVWNEFCKGYNILDLLPHSHPTLSPHWHHILPLFEKPILSHMPLKELENLKQKLETLLHLLSENIPLALLYFNHTKTMFACGFFYRKKILQHAYIITL